MVLLLEPQSLAAGDRVFQLRVTAIGGQADSAANAQALASEQIDIVSLAGGCHHALKRSFDVNLDAPAAIRITLSPVQGRPIISGIVLSPKHSGNPGKQPH